MYFSKRNTENVEQSFVFFGNFSIRRIIGQTHTLSLVQWINQDAVYATLVWGFKKWIESTKSLPKLLD